MTITEFEESKAAFECKWCGVVGKCERGSGAEREQYGVRCQSCGKHIFWLAKDRNHSKVGLNKRPALKRGTIEDVWAAFGDRCLHCGVHRKVIEALGLECTVQHVPPYHVVGHESLLYPYCSWCNRDAEIRWKHMETLAKRFNLLDYFHSGDA